MKLRFQFILLAVLGALLASVAVPSAPAQDQPQPYQQQDQQKSEKDQKKKKKGGFFSGLKAVAGQSSEQQGETATAGTKGVGEGEEIGNAQPSSADRAAVTAMENYSLPQGDVKKFQTDGKLKAGK